VPLPQTNKLQAYGNQGPETLGGLADPSNLNPKERVYEANKIALKTERRLPSSPHLYELVVWVYVLDSIRTRPDKSLQESRRLYQTQTALWNHYETYPPHAGRGRHNVESLGFPEHRAMAG